MAEPRWTYGESNPANRHAPEGSVNPHRQLGELDEIQSQASRAAQAMDAARRKRQASLGRDASHDDQ